MPVQGKSFVVEAGSSFVVFDTLGAMLLCLGSWRIYALVLHLVTLMGRALSTGAKAYVTTLKKCSSIILKLLI